MKELRWEFPSKKEPKYLKKSNLDSSKVWFVLKDNKVLDFILMCDKPKDLSFLEFRNISRSNLSKKGKIRSGFVSFLQTNKGHIYVK